MKKVRWIPAAALVIAALTGCSLFCPTKLTLRNATTSVALEFLEWNGTRFGTVSVWEPLIGQDVRGLNPGHQDDRDVSPGGDYVYFELVGDFTDYRTVEYLVLERGDDYTFTFHDSTLIAAGDLLEVKNESEPGDPVRRYHVIPFDLDAAGKRLPLP